MTLLCLWRQKNNIWNRCRPKITSQTQRREGFKDFVTIDPEPYSLKCGDEGRRRQTLEGRSDHWKEIFARAPCWKDVAHRVNHLQVLSDHRLSGVVVEHVHAVRGELVAQEDVGEAKVENENPEVEKFAENKLSEISVRFVLQHIEVAHVVC
jgi:hypothetical protein